MERKVAVAAALAATTAAMTVALIAIHQHHKIHSAAALGKGGPEEDPPAGDSEDEELEALVHYRRGRAPITSYVISEFNQLLYNKRYLYFAISVSCPECDDLPVIVLIQFYRHTPPEIFALVQFLKVSEIRATPAAAIRIMTIWWGIGDCKSCMYYYRSQTRLCLIDFRDTLDRW